MTIENIKLARTEAKRFLDRVDALLKVNKESEWAVWPSKESVALRRASMDLTLARSERR